MKCCATIFWFSFNKHFLKTILDGINYTFIGTLEIGHTFQNIFPRMTHWFIAMETSTPYVLIIPELISRVFIHAQQWRMEKLSLGTLSRRFSDTIVPKMASRSSTAKVRVSLVRTNPYRTYSRYRDAFKYGSICSRSPSAPVLIWLSEKYYARVGDNPFISCWRAFDGDAKNSSFFYPTHPLSPSPVVIVSVG